MALTEDQQKRVDYLLQKGKSLEAQVAKLENYLKGADSVHPDPINAKLRLDSLSILYKEYMKYNDELAQLDPQNSQLENFLEVESRYFEVASKVNKIQRSEPIASSTLNASSLSMSDRFNLPRLPEIKIPTFDGNPKNWASFKHKFESLIHNREDLSDSIKASQLFSCLSDKALDKVSELDPSACDYQKAWQSLLDFYDRKRIVAVQHLNAILDLPKLTSATADGLSSLVDKARQHLHILSRFGARPSDELVVRIIERCLPPATLNRWQDKLEMDELPKLEELFKFIQNTIFKLQAQALDSSSGNRKRAGEPISHAPSKNGKLGARSLVTTSSSSTSTSKSSSCPKCNGDHRLFKCQAFNNLPVQERWNLVNAQELCRNCLWTHPFPCQSKNLCKKCSRNHHTLLHQDKGQKGSGSQKLKTQESKSREENASKANTPQR